MKTKLMPELKTTAEETLALAAKYAAKDEVIIMRMSKKHKAEIQEKAKKSGITVTAYMLAAEHFFSSAMANTRIPRAARPFAGAKQARGA